MQPTRSVFGRFARRLVVLIGLCLLATEAQAQKLSIQGDRFAIDATPRFLTFMTVANVGSILAGIRSVDPARIVVCSNSPVDDAQYAADFTRQLGLDATAYHEPRSSDWYALANYQSVVGRMKSNGKPAYLQEPMSTRDNLFPYPSHDRAEF